MFRKIIKASYHFLKYDIRGFLGEVGFIDRRKWFELKGLKKVEYKMKKCYIIGSGPSLTIEDLTELSKRDDVITMACNSLFKAYDLTHWRADLYCVSDDGVFNNVGSKIIESQQGKKVFVTESIYKNHLEFANSLVPFKVKINIDYPRKRKFSPNAARYTYPAGSVLYFMLQVAYYLGFQEIYLLGCDCNYSLTKQADGSLVKTGSKDYFLPDYESRKGHQPINQYEVVIPDYEEARRFADRHHVSVYNVTRGGKLESFIRMNIDEVLGQHTKS